MNMHKSSSGSRIFDAKAEMILCSFCSVFSILILLLSKIITDGQTVRSDVHFLE
jgi:hypothetical protein